MSSLYTNIDGLTQRYGNERVPAKGYTRKLSTFGALNQLVIDFDHTSLEVYDEGDPQSSVMDAFSELMAYIPEGAAIVSAYILPIVNFNQAINVGLYEKDGSVIDDDGLVAAATPTVAGGLVTGGGDEVGGVAGEDSYIVIEADAAAPTAGSARLVVTYIK